jgi:hypothetical protein
VSIASIAATSSAVRAKSKTSKFFTRRCGRTDFVRTFWKPHLDALATELARGRRERRQRGPDERTDT